jgi:nitrite reductase (NADH) small subunit
MTNVETWVEVARLGDLVPDRGVCALVGGRGVAVFRCAPRPGFPEEVLAVDNVDPFTGASVLSRGLVGSVGERTVVVSPLLKHRFDLHTGESLDDPGVGVAVRPVRVVAGRVQVAASRSSSGNRWETISKRGPGTIG